MEKVRKFNRAKIFIFFLLLIIVSSYITITKIVRESRLTYINLYFTDHGNDKLIIEKRVFNYDVDKVKNMKRVLQELSFGPLSNYLEPVLSYNTDIQDVWLSGNFIYINVNADAFRKVSNSALSIRAMNETVFMNFPSVKKIKYLIDGKMIPTVTGFEDLSVIYMRKGN